MAAPRNNTFSVASGAGVYAGRAAPSGLPSWLAAGAVNEWLQVPNSQPSTATGLQPAVAGTMGSQQYLVNAWNGAFRYGTKYHIHGGGHTDYGGNEIGAIDLSQESPAWDLLVERTPVADLLGGSNYYADGLPTSRHTYYAMAVATVGSVPRLYRFNGWMGFAYNGVPVGGSDNVRTTDVDGFRLDTNAWEPAGFGPVTAITGSESSFAQDPVTGDCFVWHGSTNEIQRYVVATDSCSEVADLSGTEGQGAAMVFDSDNQRLVRFAGRGSHKCTYWDVNAGTKNTPTLTGPDASAISGLSGSNHGWGIAHDTGRNAAYLMTNAGVLLRVRLDDWYVEEVATTGETPAAATNGTWGKLLYFPDLDCIAYLASWTSPLLAMRCG